MYLNYEDRFYPSGRSLLDLVDHSAEATSWHKTFSSTSEMIEDVLLSSAVVAIGEFCCIFCNTDVKVGERAS